MKNNEVLSGHAQFVRRWLLPALAYFVVGKLGLLVATVGANVSPVWPAAGLALALMLRQGFHIWPGIFLGATAVTLGTGLHPLASLAIGAGNTLAIVIATRSLRRFNSSEGPLASSHGVMRFVLAAGLGATTVSAAVGALALVLSGADFEHPLGLVWLTWWLGDAAGVLLAAPLFLVWRLPPPQRRRWAAMEAVGLGAATAAVSYAIFGGGLGQELARAPLAFVVLPLLIWIVFRFGARGAVIGASLVIATAIVGAYLGHGPFSRANPVATVLLLQLYLIVVTITCYLLAAVVRERELAQQALLRAGWDLESRVESRTRELAAAKERLEREASERRQAEKAQRRLAHILDATTDVVCLSDHRGRLLYLNPAGRDLLGVDTAQTTRLTVADLHPEWAMARLRELQPELERDGLWQGELAVRTSDLREIPTSHVVIAHRAPDGAVEYYSAIARDISADKDAEAELQLAASVFEEGQEAIMITDAHGVIVRVNRAFSEITGYAPQDALGRTPRILRSDHHGAAFFQAMWNSLRDGGLWQGEIWNRRPDGEIYPVWCNISAVTAEAGAVTHYIGTFIDISERKLSEERIYRLAHYDVLTGLPNRRLFQEHLSQAVGQALRHQSAMAVMFVDLDQFKLVNDSLGHAAGDALLLAAAHRLTECLRGSDIVARWGGDEFAVLLPEVNDAQGAAAVAQKVLDAFARPVQVKDQEIFAGVSIGLSLAPEDGSEPALLLRNADLAMNRAKAEGRNSFQFFTEEMNSSLSERMSLESALRGAFLRNEFVLHYQPQVATSGAIIGLEALVRWQHPEWGMVPPGRFIPLAEETGQIIALDKWVLKAACTQLTAWLRQGLPPVRMAVNISGRCFQDPRLVEDVAAVLEETGVDPSLLELELTETFLVANPEETIRTLTAIKALGVQLAIDDFGTGYSSLNYLKRFTIDRLKIDQSFVRDLPGDPEDTAIVTTIIAMGKNLGLKVTAEGVESAEQRDFLRQHGCDELQGYFFSRPAPPARVEELLQSELLPRVG